MLLNSGSPSKNDSGALGRPKKRHTHKAKMVRITLNISDGLLDMADEAAKKDFTTRSDIIRMALLWYLRPQGRELDQTDPDAIFKTLQHRRSRAAMKDIMQDVDIFND